MYADDSPMYLSCEIEDIENAKSKLNKCLIEIQHWMQSNFLKMNKEKTDLKIFNPKAPILFDLKYEGLKITPSNTINILGVNIGNNLELNSFAVKKIQSCNFHLRNLFHIRKSLPYQARVTLVTNLVISNLDYCNSVFILANNKIIQSMQTVLNKSIRFIFNLSYRSHTSPYLKKNPCSSYKI